MKQPVCCIRDQLTGYLSPFVCNNEAVAKRDFSVIIRDDNNTMYHNPQHFDLYLIGEFDTDTGKIEACEPKILLTGLSVSVKESDNVQK